MDIISNEDLFKMSGIKHWQFVLLSARGAYDFPKAVAMKRGGRYYDLGEAEKWCKYIRSIVKTICFNNLRIEISNPQRETFNNELAIKIITGKTGWKTNR